MLGVGGMGLSIVKPRASKMVQLTHPCLNLTDGLTSRDGSLAIEL